MTSGLPTMEQVREHAERHGGLWRVIVDAAPTYCYLRGLSDCVQWAFVPFISWVDFGQNSPMEAWLLRGVWTPCDRDGNPLELVEERERAREAEAKMAELARKVQTVLSEHGWARVQVSSSRYEFSHPDGRTMAFDEHERHVLARPEWPSAVPRATTDPNPGR